MFLKNVKRSIKIVKNCKIFIDFLNFYENLEGVLGFPLPDPHVMTPLQATSWWTSIPPKNTPRGANELLYFYTPWNRFESAQLTTKEGQRARPPDSEIDLSFAIIIYYDFCSQKSDTFIKKCDTFIVNFSLANQTISHNPTFRFCSNDVEQ